MAAILTAAILNPAARAQERIEVPRAELGQALAGHVVSTVLADGTVLRGHLLDVSADQLRFDANKTQNRVPVAPEDLFPNDSWGPSRPAQPGDIIVL